MYTTVNSIIRNIKIADINKQLTNDAYLEKRYAKEDIGLPIGEEKKMDIPKDLVLSQIKVLTYEPNKFYSLLFDNNEIQDFVERLPEFLSHTKRRNLSANDLFYIWTRFITLTIDKQLAIKGVPQDEIEAYDEEVMANAIKTLPKTEMYKRRGISSGEARIRNNMSKLELDSRREALKNSINNLPSYEQEKRIKELMDVEKLDRQNIKSSYGSSFREQLTNVNRRITEIKSDRDYDPKNKNTLKIINDLAEEAKNIENIIKKLEKP
jgi:hypothetical protein